MPLANTFICINPSVCLCFNAVPSCGPTNVSAFATTSSSILVRWFEVPEPDRNGLILGYKVCEHFQVKKEKNTPIVKTKLQKWLIKLIHLNTWLQNTCSTKLLFPCNESERWPRLSLVPIHFRFDLSFFYCTITVCDAALYCKLIFCYRINLTYHPNHQTGLLHK